ncbi:MAG: hypothetical protein A2V98_00690 [Planctomycetes bacterium RBG_16_64_12]|nr:MAG: hypothetical protein A2V98_00690 [Planctomycetes bacterium RBG_16_64_12]
MGQLFAYVGPGAGFALLSSFVAFFVAFLLAGLIFLTAPVRLWLGALRRRGARKRGRFKRVVIVGLDGMSPVVARRMIDSGHLPHFAALEAEGTFQPLESTLPSVSPTAWSTFQTGTHPDRHNIFDFLACDRKRYLPVLSSARIQPAQRVLKLGKYSLPLGRPRIRLLRKSQPFWKILGEHGVFSIVLRVPITFPPEKFHGVLLSGMCVPDLRGTQGSFTYFTTAAASGGEPKGGTRIRVKREGTRITTAIPGPENPLKDDAPPLEVPLTVLFEKDGETVELVLPGQRICLKPRTYSPWIRLSFRAGFGVKVRGICRFYLKEAFPTFGLYMSPLNIDPEMPALPLSHPFVYAAYLAKVFGPYATLGLAEDTWALDEQVLDEGSFLEQAYDIHAERERMFFDACRKVDQGMVACVFDITDRIQHMFWQYTQEARSAGSRPEPSDHAAAVEECYRRMDEMVGRLRKTLSRDDLLMVISDHGFAAFHTCVNLNAWLRQEGFLVLKEGARQCEGYFKNVDWSRSKAYALGLGGVFINQAGREAGGIVREGDQRRAVAKAIAEGLLELKDPDSGKKVVNRVFDLREHYRGPYVDNGPDLIVGFADGYRVSWDCVTGGFGSEVVEANEKSWSGDHCVDPAVVPGVLFSNRPLVKDKPGIIDVAPTVLDVFGIPVPGYMQGRSLLAAAAGGDSRLAQEEASEDAHRTEAIQAS